MSEIRIDGKLLTESIIDGENVTEVLIDGCSITFEKSGATPWFYISGGSGSYNVDFTGSEYNEIIIAGIRFKGADPRTTTPRTSYTSWQSSSTLSTPNPPTPPFGCSHGPKKYHTMQASTGAGCEACVFTNSSTFKYCEIDFYNSHTVTAVSRQYIGSGEFIYGAWDTVTGSSTCGAAYRVRTFYDRTCISAMNDGNASGDITYIDVNGGATKLSPLFTASKDTIRPTSSSANLTIEHNGTTYYLFELGQFIAGNNNTINFQNIRGSGNVHAQLVYVYR